MSLFGTSPTEASQAPSTPSRSRGRGGNGLFDDEARPSSGQGRSSSSLFADDAPDSSGHDDSPWDMPTPRKQQSRAELIRRLLPSSDVPDSYIETFDTVVREEGSDDGRVGAAGIAKVFASARLGTDAQKRIMTLISADSNPSEATLGRDEFNVLLALVGLAQEGDVINLDGVDERRRSK
jgi:sorting nexin-8